MTAKGDRQEGHGRRKRVAEILASGVRRMVEEKVAPEGARNRSAAGTTGRRTPLTVGEPRVVQEGPHLIVTCDLNPAWLAERARRQGRGKTRAGPRPPGARSAPLVSRALAVAHRFERKLRRGKWQSFAEIAAAEHMTRARVTQIMNLLLLAPDIQEDILFLPKPKSPEDVISERDLRPILRTPIWSEQRRLWKELRGRRRVRLFFAADAWDRATARRWGTGRRTRRARGGFELAVRTCPTAEFVAWVLGFGGKVEVLEPASLRAEVAAELARASARYQPPAAS